MALPHLTPREWEVVTVLLMFPGLTNKGVARKLGFAEGTAKIHIANLMRKMGARRRASLVAALIRESYGIDNRLSTVADCPVLMTG